MKRKRRIPPAEGAVRGALLELWRATEWMRDGEDHDAHCASWLQTVKGYKCKCDCGRTELLKVIKRAERVLGKELTDAK